MSEFLNFLDQQEPFDSETEWTEEAIIMLELLLTLNNDGMSPMVLGCLAVLFKKVPKETRVRVEQIMQDRIDEVIDESEEYQTGVEEIHKLLGSLEHGE